MTQLRWTTYATLAGAATFLAVLGTFSASASATETALQFSYDGSSFLESLPHQLFVSGMPVLIPGGQPAVDTFYVRNSSDDPAQLAIRSSPKSVDGTSTPNDLRTLSVLITMGETPNEQLIKTQAPLASNSTKWLGPGETTLVRVAISLRWMSDDAADGDIGERMVIDPGITVDLRLAPQAEPIHEKQPLLYTSDAIANESGRWLANTGVRGLSMVVLVSGVALSLGIFLVMLRREGRGQ